MTPEQIIKDIIRREGGYNDIKEDQGGATNLGISLRYAKGVGLDMDGDGDTDKDDIKMVDEKTATKLYKNDFFTGPRINTLPVSIQAQMFDIAVNAGPPRAIMMAQTITNQAGFGPVDQDGVIGPMSRAAIERAVDDMGPWFGNALVEERLAHYRRIIKNRPSQQKFWNGWHNRAMEFYKEI